MKNLSHRARHRLLRHHLVLGAICVFLLLGLHFAIPSANSLFRWSMATAYVALGLLALTLVIWPINLLPINAGRRGWTS